MVLPASKSSTAARTWRSGSSSSAAIFWGMSVDSELDVELDGMAAFLLGISLGR